MEKAASVRFSDLGPAAQEALRQLSDKQRAFITAYFNNNKNMAEAYRLAYGQSQQSPSAKAKRLLATEAVQAVVEEIDIIMASRFEVTEQKILKTYAQLCFGDIREFFDEAGNLLPIQELPQELANMIVSFDVEELWEGFGKERKVIGETKKVRLVNRKEALDSLAKTQGMFIAVDKTKGKEKAKVVRFPAAVGKDQWEGKHS